MKFIPKQATCHAVLLSTVALAKEESLVQAEAKPCTHSHSCCSSCVSGHAHAHAHAVAIAKAEAEGVSGFTLVELSIVIVIIGLIAAGITVGQSLVGAAKLRTLSNEISQYKVAYNSFRSQYDALPGDMANAYDYWGAVTGCTNNDVNVTASGCNGNNNKRINGPHINIVAAKEEYRAWQFLAQAGFIPGVYSGTGGFTLGVNLPVSKYSSAAAVSIAFNNTYYRYSAAGGPTSNAAKLNYNYLYFASIRVWYNINGSVSTTKDAYNIDVKIDDGLPISGKFIAFTGYPVAGGPEDPVANHCATSNAYILTHNVVACALMAQMDF